MQSRERVLTSLNHQEPDRVPMDFGGTTFTGIQVTAYDALKKLLGVETPTTIVNKRAQLVAVEDAIKDRLHVDLDGISPNPPARPPDAAGLPAHISVDEWGVHWLSGPSGEHAATNPPLAGMETVAEIEAYPWPDPADPARCAGLREKALALKARSQRAVCFNLGGQIASRSPQHARLRTVVHGFPPEPGPGRGHHAQDHDDQPDHGRTRPGGHRRSGGRGLRVRRPGHADRRPSCRPPSTARSSSPCSGSSSASSRPAPGPSSSTTAAAPRASSWRISSTPASTS